MSMEKRKIKGDHIFISLNSSLLKLLENSWKREYLWNYQEKIIFILTFWIVSAYGYVECKLRLMTKIENKDSSFENPLVT